jgi:serine/threonine protein kinase
MPADAHDPYEGTVDIVKEVNPTHAYMAIPSLERKSLDHHGPGWGYVSFGVILPRLADGVYQMPRSDNCDRVAIKCLNKRVVELALKAGVKEDPYNEIRRMHTIGDNVHVLGCIEALHDETYLYIIMPYCEEESIASCIPRQQGLPEHQARRAFGQIVENLMYLRHYRICHRDLSPDNCMIYKGRAVFNDLARSFQVPPESSYVYGMGAHGKPAFLAPEVFVPNAVFNAFGCDLWAAVLTLFYLLTGEILYLIPQPTDLCFCYFVLARGISRTPSNEMFTEILQDLEGAKRMSFWRVASKCLQLSPEALEVLDNVLRMSPQERWDVDAVAASAFMNPTKKSS